jgi:CRISPR/Cas system-associated exonuclease Cas4 (RecB family)
MADLQETRATIETVARGVRARTFTATPGYMECSYCAFREICPRTAYRETD